MGEPRCVFIPAVAILVCVVGIIAGPTYADERVLEFGGTEGDSLTIHCNASGGQNIKYDFFKVTGLTVRSHVICLILYYTNEEHLFSPLRFPPSRRSRRRISSLSCVFRSYCDIFMPNLILDAITRHLDHL